MDHTSPHPPSLLTRIKEADTAAPYTVDRSILSRPRQASFAERYRGTEYDSPTTVLVAREPRLSRGRSFVLVLGATTIGVALFLLAAAPG